MMFLKRLRVTSTLYIFFKQDEVEKTANEYITVKVQSQVREDYLSEKEHLSNNRLSSHIYNTVNCQLDDAASITDSVTTGEYESANDDDNLPMKTEFFEPTKNIDFLDNFSKHDHASAEIKFCHPISIFDKSVSNSVSHDAENYIFSSKQWSFNSSEKCSQDSTPCKNTTCGQSSNDNSCSVVYQLESYDLLSNSNPDFNEKCIQNIPESENLIVGDCNDFEYVPNNTRNNNSITNSIINDTEKSYSGIENLSVNELCDIDGPRNCEMMLKRNDQVTNSESIGKIVVDGKMLITGISIEEVPRTINIEHTCVDECDDRIHNLPTYIRTSDQIVTKCTEDDCVDLYISKSFAVEEKNFGSTNYPLIDCYQFINRYFIFFDLCTPEIYLEFYGTSPIELPNIVTRFVFNDCCIFNKIVNGIQFYLANLGKYRLSFVIRESSFENLNSDDIDENLYILLKFLIPRNSIDFQTAVGIGYCVGNIRENDTLREIKENYAPCHKINTDLDERKQICSLPMEHVINQFNDVQISDETNKSFDISPNNMMPIMNENTILDVEDVNITVQPDTNDMSRKENVSEAGPATAADIDNVHNAGIFNNTTDMEYFSHLGGTGTVAENLRKQSLYVKFDPLVAAAADSSTNGKHDTSNSQIKQKLNENTMIADSNTSISKDPDTSIGTLISVTPSKTPTSITPSKTPPKSGSAARYVEADQEEVTKLHSLLLKQMKKEETFQEEINHIKSDYETLTQKLSNAENEIAKLNSTLDVAHENEQNLKKELKEKIKGKQQLSMVMEEYEKTISQMVLRREEEKKEHETQLKKLETERDSAVQHLNNLEIAFNDIHQKYERGKAVNEALKKNEDGLKKSLAEYEKAVKVVENKYEMLKSHAATQLEKANQELELITQSYENEQAKLKVLLRKAELQINSLQDSLDRKVKENQELTSICDELILKLSSHSSAQ